MLWAMSSIAQEKIPPDRLPENAGIDTRQDEVMIRITAVEGIVDIWPLTVALRQPRVLLKRNKYWSA